MRRLTLVIFILLMLPNNLMANEKILVINVTGQPPLNTDDQTGFMDDVAKEAFRRIGYQLKTVRLPAERGLVNANRGIVDGEMSRVKGINKVYKNLLRVPEKIMDWQFVGFSYQPIEFKNGWGDLSGRNVAHINGWKIFEKNVPSTAEMTKTKNAISLFNLLKRKRTDIALYERWGGHYLLHKMYMKEVKMCKQPLAVKEMYMYLNKKHRALVFKISQALVAMKRDGSYEKLFNKHLMPFKGHPEKEHLGHLNQ